MDYLSIISKTVSHHGWKHGEGNYRWRKTIFKKLFKLHFGKNFSGECGMLFKEKNEHRENSWETLATRVIDFFCYISHYFKHHILTPLNYLSQIKFIFLALTSNGDIELLVFVLLIRQVVYRRAKWKPAWIIALRCLRRRAEQKHPHLPSLLPTLLHRGLKTGVAWTSHLYRNVEVKGNVESQWEGENLAALTMASGCSPHLGPPTQKPRTQVKIFKLPECDRESTYRKFKSWLHHNFQLSVNRTLSLTNPSLTLITRKSIIPLKSKFFIKPESRKDLMGAWPLWQAWE